MKLFGEIVHDDLGDRAHDLLRRRVAEVHPARGVGDQDALGHHVDHLPQPGQAGLSLCAGRLLAQQLLAALARVDRVDGDTHRFRELVEEGQVDRAESGERGQLDDRAGSFLDDDRDEDNG